MMKVIFTELEIIDLIRVNTNHINQIRFNRLLSLLFLAFASCAGHTDSKTEGTPLQRLLEGNKRFQSSHPHHPHQTRERLKEITTEQNPFAIVVSCSDSRVPPEIVFDQGLGDLFVIRTAGNVIGDYELASIEYAVNKLHCQIIIILGHEECGAIKTFIDQPLDSLPSHLNELVDFIKRQPYADKVLIEKNMDRNYHGVINNIIYGVTLIKKESPLVRKQFEDNKLEIVGAVYHMDSGLVQVISDEVKK